MGRRFGLAWGKDAQRKTEFAAGHWDEPLKWNAAAAKAGVRRRVFANSMGDWLEDRDDLVEPLARMLWLIGQTPDLDWILCTKRPENWQRRMEAVKTLGVAGQAVAIPWLAGQPPENIWVLASAEDQAMADKRIPELLRFPARIHGLSCEPLLGPINLAGYLNSLAWCVIGGETGRQARPCQVEWIVSLVRQCRAAGVPCYVKQWGATPVTQYGSARTQGVNLGNMATWPPEMRVREFPC